MKATALHGSNNTTQLGTTRLLAPLSYLDAGCQLTLREGLAEYHASIDGLLTYEELSPLARKLFRRHDAAHVVFGCDTSIAHEATVDIWTMFGTDVGVGAYLDYLRIDEAKATISDTGYLRVIKASLAAIPLMFRGYRAARKMKKKWPWQDHEAYLDVALSDIREEFGIVPVPSRAA